MWERKISPQYYEKALETNGWGYKEIWKTYVNKLNNLDEMDNFIGRHKLLLKRTQEERENLNRLI